MESTKYVNDKNIFLNHMCGRLVLINKVHPKTPTINDIRPITVLSPIRKFLEMQISEKIKHYCTTKINKAQTGFIETLGTDINLYRISEYLKDYDKIERSHCGVLFIDFKAAFDCVPHNKLLSIIY